MSAYRDAMAAYRKALVETALTQAGGNRCAAGRALGLRREYVQTLIRQLGITIPSPHARPLTVAGGERRARRLAGDRA